MRHRVAINGTLLRALNQSYLERGFPRKVREARLMAFIARPFSRGHAGPSTPMTMREGARPARRRRPRISESAVRAMLAVGQFVDSYHGRTPPGRTAREHFTESYKRLSGG